MSSAPKCRDKGLSPLALRLALLVRMPESPAQQGSPAPPHHRGATRFSVVTD